MKLKTLLSIALVALVSKNTFSQPSSIGEINKYVHLIKAAQDSFEKTEKVNSESGTRDIYFKDGEVQVISVTESGKIEKQVEWFYKNGLLIYTETNWRDSLSLKPLFNERTYHYKGTMIAWLDNENSFVDSSSPLFKKMEKELNAYAMRIREEALE